MSGGVDSSLAACLLCEQGYDVTGLFMRTGVHEAADTCTPTRQRGCCSAADASDARAVAGRLGIPFYALNFKEDFDRLIDHFADEYIHGRTPNPCVLCNEYLKFGRLAEYGRAVGADFIATGHYARIATRDNRPCLARAADRRKDQSYVLFGIDRNVLPRILFPIGHLTKDEVRAEAQRRGLTVSNKPESMDICFVPDRDYARVVRERRPEAFVAGPVLDQTGREVGRHSGIAGYTIGQRQGLGIALGLPVYVTKIDAAANTITLGPKDHLAAPTLSAQRMHWLIDPPTAPFRAEVQIRYAHRAAPASVEPLSDPDSPPAARIRVLFDTPQTAVTPGQAAVLYDNDAVLGGGWIE